MAREALAAADGAFRAYSSPKSPHKFTQPQLAACLVVKEFLRLDYRGASVWESAASSPSTRAAGGGSVPPFGPAAPTARNARSPCASSPTT